MLKERHFDPNLPAVISFLESKKSKNSQEESKERWKKADQNSITIKFVGDSKDNIKDVVSSLPCSDYCKAEVSHILSLYFKKIDKLREERNFYKKLVTTKQEENSKTIAKLKKRIEKLEEKAGENCICECICQQCTCFDNQNEPHYFIEQYSNIDKQNFTESQRQSEANDPSQSQSQSFLEICSQKEGKKSDEALMERKKSTQGREQTLLIEGQSNEKINESQEHSSQLESNYSFQSEIEEAGQKITEEQLLKLMLKYNFSLQELEQVLSEYEVEHKLAFQLFDSQSQRNLYKLGHKMQKALWNKKVMKDIKRLTQIKTESLNANNPPQKSIK